MTIIRTMRQINSENIGILEKMIELANVTVSWVTGYCEFKMMFDPYGKNKACRAMVHTPNKPPLTVACFRNRHSKIIGKEKHRLNRNLSVGVAMLSPIASGSTPSDPSTMEGGVAMEEQTVVSDGTANDTVVTVVSSSEGSVFAPPEPKRPKAVAKPMPKSLKRSKGKGKGVVIPNDDEDPPRAEVPAANNAHTAHMDQTCEFEIAPQAAAQDDHAAGSQSDISGISGGSQRGYQRENIGDVTVISSDQDRDIADLPSPHSANLFPPLTPSQICWIWYE